MDAQTAQAADDRSARPIGPGPQALSPRILVLWRGGALAVAAVVTAALTLAVVAAGAAGAVVAGVAVVIGLASVSVAVVLPAATYRRWRYEVTPDGLELRHGLVVRQASSIPHFRVQHVDLRQGPLQRWLGVVSLAISTASAATDAQLPGLEPDRAETIRRLVLDHAQADDGV